MYKIMTPGPTQVRENVRRARSLETTNPDLDPVFYDYYRDTCRLISKLLQTENETYILDGEGILGLEAACASLTEPGDRVLVLDNGIYGKGFAEFVSLYGGEPVLFSSSYISPLPLDELKEFLKNNHDFKYATMVHCDTPSGMLNDVEALGRLLKEYDILTVVDSVSGMFGEPLNVDNGELDIVCGGSQKALSAPPGLSFVTVSSAAMQAMKKRKVPIASFYANILAFEDYYKNQWFPYTMPISDIYGLRTALENVDAEPGIFKRHKELASAVRDAVRSAGLSLYQEEGFSNTVTVIRVPEGLAAEQILSEMRTKHGIMLAGSFDVLAGQVIRIGHMGENANKEDVCRVMEALGETLTGLGRPTEFSLSL